MAVPLVTTECESPLPTGQSQRVKMMLKAKSQPGGLRGQLVGGGLGSDKEVSPLELGLMRAARPCDS